MIANIKYIYSDSEEIEAAIVPIQKWRSITQQIQAKPKDDFDPAAFENILVHYDLDAIIQEMRD